MSVLSTIIFQLKRFAVGFFLVTVCLVIIFCVFVINTVSAVEEPPEWFERYISEFVMIDFPQFSATADIPMEKLISFGVWKCLDSDPDSKKYPIDKTGIRYIEENDVIANINKYFELKEQVTPVSAPPFEYLPDKNLFTVPIFGIEDAFFPKVKNITRSSNDKVIVTADYYSMDEYMKSENPQDLKPKKSVMITLNGKDKNYKFAEMRLIN